MKKYLFIFKASILENLQYKSRIILGLVSFTIHIFIFSCLWKYLYSDTSQLIEGYSYSQMIWYLIVTETLWYGTRSKILVEQITQDIKTGNVAYNINKPYNYVIYIVSKFFGDIAMQLIIYIIVAVTTGIIFVGPLEGFQLVNIPLILIIGLFGITINALIRIVISLLSFWIEDAIPFHWLYDKIILILGTLIPIELFPKWLQKIAKYLPSYVVVYGTARLIVKFSMDVFYKVLLAQFIYLIIVVLIIIIIYKKGVKKLNVNGG